jgi:ubiquinone/menaquinone biosynthesis C-methylase UbiE
METSFLCNAMGLSTDKIFRAVVAKIRETSPQVHGKYLDIGAGHGRLMRLLAREFKLEPTACDYTSDLMRVQGIRVDVVDLNTDALPYRDAAFDLITCTEVVEHVERYRHTFREIFRILKPGGTLIVTTPNVLNLRSRIRYLLFGFFSLFGPLTFRESQRYLTGGHINPVSYFYMAHALSDAGFADISVSIDKRQRGSMGWLILLWLPLKFFSLWALRREKHRYKTIDATNQRFVREMNSADLLLGRTVVVGCRKKI